ncbi:NmrA family NAD(P)-binding protein [Burkholderia sp. S171]|jgi:NAD(P)H dehydrogenase (quinone)|uniref:NmrA family NAD(P)-binding protein n=1 Tax=Burkholderia sp. S171 TaxID=1641860 RepID=UPI00131A8017|nr:NmrA family NAD(P)-binding protein [Burkholderia sp. S171]
MSDELYLVTGATGATGRSAIDHLLSKGSKVRAFVHNDDDRAAALRASGVEVVLGDLLDNEAVQKAVQGVTSAYFVYPVMQPQLVDASAYFAHASIAAGVRSIVNMSQISARVDAVSHAARSHWYGERVFDWAGVPVTHLRPTFFMEWLTYGFQLPLIANHDLIKVPAGNGRHAPISAEDQGRAIANIMLDPVPHAGKIYPLYGAVEMNHKELASAVGEALGRTIRYEPESFDEFGARLNAIGMPKHFIQHIVAVYRDYQNGDFAGINNSVEALTGRKPMTVGEYVKANSTLFQPKQQ